MTRLELHDFRNFVQVSLEPAPAGLTVVNGDNGAGKTSLLEAIVYASTLQSFRGVSREAVVREGSDKARISCHVIAGTRKVDVEVAIEPGRRDQAWHNTQRVPGARGLLEVLRTTLFTPDDLALVKAGPVGRRDLLDSVLATAHPRLGADRGALDKVIRHRNALLRQLGGRLGSEAGTTLDVWDARLVEIGGRLAQSRARLVTDLAPFAARAFGALSPRAGPLELSYESSVDGDLAGALARSRRDDLRRQTTTVGPQRDDLCVTAGGLDARSRLSQGRQRCVALSLKLAAHHLVTEVTGGRPVLLLDDAFSELDEATAHALVAQLPGGQALLTTAGPVPSGAHPELVVRIDAGRIVG